jgi:hypothetical protein
MDSSVCADASPWTEVDIPVLVCPHFHFAPHRPHHIHLKLRVSAVRPEIHLLIDHSRCELEFARLENSSIPTNFFILYMISFPPFSYILLLCFPPILRNSVIFFFCSFIFRIFRITILMPFYSFCFFSIIPNFLFPWYLSCCSMLNWVRTESNGRTWWYGEESWGISWQSE